MASRSRSRVQWPTLTRSQQRARRRRRKTIVKLGPLSNTVLGIVFSLVALVFLVVGLILQSFLWYLVMAVAAGAALAERRAMQMQRDQAQEKRAHRGPQQPRTTAKPMPGAPPPAEPQQPVGQVKCTEKGLPIEQCKCASRHVATQDGVERYGLPLGSPLGRRNKDDMPAKTVKN